jgi:hypothetical protein
MTAYHFGNAISDKYALITGATGATSAVASPSGVIEVQMVRHGGTYAVPVLINNAITLDFVLDSGASDVSIPSDVFSTLIRAGTITKEDIIGSDTYTLADGSQKKVDKVPHQILKGRPHSPAECQRKRGRRQRPIAPWNELPEPVQILVGR